MTRLINVLRKPLRLLAVCAVIITLATGCPIEDPCELGQGDGLFDFHGITVEPRAYGHLKNTVDRRVVTPKDDTLYQVIQRYDTLFGLELATTDNDTLGRVPTDPDCKPYGYLLFIKSLDVVSNAAEIDSIYANMGMRATKELLIKRGYEDTDFTLSEPSSKGAKQDFADQQDELGDIFDIFTKKKPKHPQRHLHRHLGRLPLPTSSKRLPQRTPQHP